MIFSEAAAFVMPLGIYVGKKLDDIAKTDSGLLYLDWLAGRDWLKANLKEALATYLGDKAIAAELERLVKK